MTPHDADAAAGGGPYLAVLRRRLPLVLVPLLLGAVLGGVFAVTRAQSFSARVDVLVRAGATNPLTQDTSGRLPSVNTATEVQVAASGSVGEVVSRRLEGAVSSDELLRNVRVLAREDSQVLSFNYTAGSADAARSTALAFAQGYLDYRSDRIREEQASSQASLDRRAAEIRAQLAIVNASLAQATAGSAEAAATQAEQTALASQLAQVGLQQAVVDGLVVDPGSVITAQPPVVPAGPPLSLLVLSGAVLGLLVGLLLAAVRERTDDRLRFVAGSSTDSPYPVLARVPRSRSTGESLAGRPYGVPQEYAALAAKLSAVRSRQPLHVLMVSSPTSHEQTSTVTAQLAAALAAAGGRVAAVSLRQGGVVLADLLDADEEPMTVEVPVAEAVQEEHEEHYGYEQEEEHEQRLGAAGAAGGGHAPFVVHPVPHDAGAGSWHPAELADPGGHAPSAVGWPTVTPGQPSSPAESDAAANVQRLRAVPSPQAAVQAPVDEGPVVHLVAAAPGLGVVVDLGPESRADDLRDAVAYLQRDWDWVVIDAMPVLQRGGALEAAPVADGVLLVVDGDGVRREDLAQTDDSLQWASANVLGLVVERAVPRRHVRR